MPIAYATVDPTPTFGTRPSQASISINGGTNFSITNKFFNQFVGGPGGEYIELDNFTGNISITDCDFDTVSDALGPGRRCIYLFGCTGTVTIARCRAKLIPQNFIQFNNSHMAGSIFDCRVRGTTTNSEDIISMFRSGGQNTNNRLLIYNNHIDGNIPNTSTPGYTSNSGSGMLLCDAALDANTGFIDVVNNTVLNPGQVGIGVDGGTEVNLIGNQVYATQLPLNNVGVFFRIGSSSLCQNMSARQNRVQWINPNGVGTNDLYNPNQCGTIAMLADNVFGDPTLNPANLAVNLK